MKIFHVLLFCFVSAQHIEFIAAKINVFPNAEGTNGSVICSFGSSGGRKFFCRRECKGENVLIKTDEDASQNGRYSIQYKHKSAQRGFLTVNIAQLIKSDSGRYRCGLGGSLVPQRYVDFDIKVTDASQSGSARKEIPVHRGIEGKDIRVFCHFSQNKNPKFFCRNQCKDGDVLIETSEVRAQKGRYITEYEDGSVQNSIALFVTISQVTESDSGRYRCGLGSPSSPDLFREFDIRVGDTSTTSELNTSTSVPKTSHQSTASTTSEPNPSTSVPKTSHQSTAPTTSCSSTSVPETSVQPKAVSYYSVSFWPLVVCCLLVLLSVGFLLSVYVWRKRRNSGINIGGKADETAMESLLLPPLCSVETPPAVLQTVDLS